MSEHGQIQVDRWEARRRVAQVEGRALPPDAPPAAEAMQFTVTTYPDQVSVNVPATAPGRAFLSRLTEILGPPKLEPTIKCSCDWGEGIMGAMLAALWEIPQDEMGAQRVREMEAFLGGAEKAAPSPSR
jgi:hypothetical protein